MTEDITWPTTLRVLLMAMVAALFVPIVLQNAAIMGAGTRLVLGITFLVVAWFIWIFTRLRISPEGRVIQCDIMRSFGDKNADDWTCALLRDRATFKPATDASGKPVAGWFGYVQSDRDL